MPVDRTKRKSVLVKYSSNQLNSFTHASVSPGACRGMCLDWVRRIHHGKRKFSGDVFTYKSKEQPLEKAQKRLSKIKDTHSLFDRELDAIPLMGFESILVRHVRVTLPHIQLKEGTEQELKKLKRDDLKTVMDEMRKLRADADLRGMYMLYAQSKNYETAFSQFKSAWKSQTQRKSNFGSIQLRAHSLYIAQQLMDGQELWGSFVQKCLPSLTEGSAMLVTGVRAGDSAGHAVAFNIDDGGEFFYYMDPNEGEFKFARDDVLTEDSRLEDFFVNHWDALYRYEFNWACWFIFS